jgi:ATP-dependent helicase HrpB
LLSERDLVKGRNEDADLRHRLDLLHGEGSAERGARDRVRRSAEAWRKQLGVALDRSPNRHAAGAVVALAYPDRLAQKRGGPGQYRLSNGKGARLDETDPLAREEFLAVAALDGDRREARVFLAGTADPRRDRERFRGGDRDGRSDRLESRVGNRRSEIRAAALVAGAGGARAGHAVGRSPSSRDDRGHSRDGSGRLCPGRRRSKAWRQRIAFCARRGRGRRWPDLGDAALLAGLEDWLAPFLSGITRRSHLVRVDLKAALEAQLDWKLKKKLDEAAPTHVAVPFRLAHRDRLQRSRRHRCSRFGCRRCSARSIRRASPAGGCPAAASAVAGAAAGAGNPRSRQLLEKRLCRRARDLEGNIRNTSGQTIRYRRSPTARAKPRPR